MKYLKWITPFTILILFLVMGCIYVLAKGGGPEGYGYLAIPAALVITCVAILLELVFRKVFALKFHWLWLAESLVVLAFIYYLIVR